MSFVLLDASLLRPCPPPLEISCGGLSMGLPTVTWRNKNETSHMSCHHDKLLLCNLL